MNHVETVRGDVAQLVREHVLDVDAVLFGITFDGRRLVVAGGDRLWRLVTDTGREVDELETSPSPGGLAYDGRHHVWQLSADRLQQLEPRTGFVVRSLELRLVDVTGLECLGHDVLVLHGGGRWLARLETLDATVVDQFETNAPLRGLGRVGGELWSATSDELVRLDPASGRILARVALPAGIEVCDLAADAERLLWCVDGSSSAVRALKH
jgi:hypothetical protein